MSTPGSHDDESRPVDPATEQALPADAGVAAGGADAPDASTRVHDVPAPEGAVGARALGSAEPAGEPVADSGIGDQQEPPAGASTGGPSGTAMGTPGGVAAGIADKLPSSLTDKIPSSVTEKASGLTEKLPVDAQVVQEKPELLVAGAFVGGFLVAKVLRRIAGV